MLDNRKRASRIYRLKNPPSMRLTERDMLTIKAVNDFRVMRQDQVQHLLYPSPTPAQRRLWLLWQHKYLKRAFLPVITGAQTSPILYMVDKRGVDLLKSEFDYSNEQLRYSRKTQISSRFLEHTLGIGDIRLSVEFSCKERRFTLQEWYDEKKIKSDFDRVDIRGRRGVSVLPDAYLKLALGNVHDKTTTHLYFFIEYDRGNESLLFFKRKIQTYSVYFQSGKCNKRYGTNLIRVLSIFEGGSNRTGTTRLQNICKLAEKTNTHSYFWFATLNDVSKYDFLTAPIWWRPKANKQTELINAST